MFDSYCLPVSSDERLAISRLLHRVGFGPRPGQFQAMLAKGFTRSASEVLALSPPIYGDVKLQLGITDLGPQPRPNTEAVVPYADAKRNQLRAMSLWWLDQMVLQDFPFHERMTWFWHGHWATSFAKVDEPLVMFDHIERLRKHSLGNFTTMCQELVTDAALMMWLDGQLNTAISPNENFARELLELFTLGVNRYSESDVKEVARVLSGWKVEKHSGVVARNLRQSYLNPTTVLGTTALFDAVSLARFLSQQPSSQRFIAERLWFRFVSSSVALPSGSGIESGFAGREILQAMKNMIMSKEFADPANAMVKSPLEWMVGVLRALRITPSTYVKPDELLKSLTVMGQRHLFPPNVGGWASDESWLTAASAQLRIQTAQKLCSHGDLSPVTAVAQASRLDALADWLGVVQWSQRTRDVLTGAITDPKRLVALALVCPEYVVNS